MALEEDTVVMEHETLKSPAMWRCVVGYLSTFRKITLPSSSGSNSASIMICPMIFRNYSPPTTQRYVINTRFLSSTCGKNPQILWDNILRNLSVTVWSCWNVTYWLVRAVEHGFLAVIQFKLRPSYLVPHTGCRDVNVESLLQLVFTWNCKNYCVQLK